MTQDDPNLKVYMAHRPALVAYAASIVGSRDRAEDVVQEAYIRFAPGNGGAAIREVDNASAFLYRIVRNLALDWSRRSAMEGRHETLKTAYWAVPDEPATPEQEAIRQDALSRVAAALAELPDDVRIACEMNRFGGFTLAEIAAELGVSVPTAHRLVKSGLLAVARALGEPE